MADRRAAGVRPGIAVLDSASYLPFVGEAPVASMVAFAAFGSQTWRRAWWI